ncbi:MAG: nickel-dependent lactate racemase [Candidatus Methanoperedenaceae archaeon]|nr:nickel-dependent lactate racemase [Candidatus Methanoperedenaceae archaeon]
MDGSVLYHLPYGNAGLQVDIPGKFDVRVVKPDNTMPEPGGIKEIERALSHPVNSRRLSEIAQPGNSAVIIASDTTRPTPTAELLPPLVSELTSGGVDDITVVFGLGIHRKQTEDEKKSILGELYGRVRCIEHDINDCVNIGTTSRGTPVEIFRHVVDADIIVCTGTIEFHYYAGYSGGAKSILPAVASKRSINKNHALMLDPDASAGYANSPVRQDIEEAGRMAGIDFILNVVLNDRKEIVSACAGHFIEAHRKGVDLLDRLLKVQAEPADIVIVSPGGYPKDINIFQSHKALEHVKNTVKPDGSVILVAECREGYGNAVFEEWLCSGRDEVIHRFKSGFVMGGHKAALIASLSRRFDLYLVSSLPDDVVRKAYFIPSSLQDALGKALDKHGQEAKIVIVPNGVSTLVYQVCR